MADPKLTIEIDAEGMAEAFGDLKFEVEEALTEAVKKASVMAYGIANELAAEKLRTRLKTYQEALHYEEVSPGLWVISLDEKAMFIEEGLEPHDQRTTLLGKGAKIAKDGTKYRSIPFEHSKNPSQQTARAREISSWAKKLLKQNNIPYKKIEKDPQGNPLVGKLHTIKNSGTARPSAKAKFPALDGLNIYQTKQANGKIRRDIMTFRTITSKPGDTWQHPGLRPEKILDITFDKIQRIFDEEILPSVLSQYSTFEG